MVLATFPLPKIVYDPGTGPVTLAFSFPPTSKPGAEQRSVVRHDSDTLSGYRQSMFVHSTRFLTLQLTWVKMTDLPNWELFFDYALTGGAFDYYPDVLVPGTFKTYTLDDTDWKSAFAFRTMATFSLKMRLVGASS